MDLPTTRYDKQEPEAYDIKKDASSSSISRQNIFESISFYVILIAIFLTPIFFLPTSIAPIDVAKTLIISVGVLVSTILCAIFAIKNKTIVLPKGPIAYSVLVVILSIVVSSILSLNPDRSFFGQGFEIGTGSFLILMFVSVFLVSYLVLKNSERLFKIYTAIFLAFVVVLLFHVIRVIGGIDVLSFGIFTSSASSLIGKWYDFVVLSGFVGLISFVSLKSLPLSKIFKIILIATLVICGFVLVVANFSLLWWTMVLVALAFGIFEYKNRTVQGEGLKKITSRISLITLIILVISLVFAWKGDSITPKLTSSLNLEYVELVLPWQMTLDVVSGTVKESPLFGAGPNFFVDQFLKYKSFQAINPTPFWGREFNVGFANIPSLVVSQGLIGLIAWFVFFVFFVRLGVAGLKRADDQFKKFSIVSTFFGASFLWIINLLYVPSHSVFFLTFIMTGLFLASLGGVGLFSFKEFNNSGKKGKYAFALSIVVLLVALFWLGSYVKSTVAIAYFQSGVRNLGSSESLPKAESKFQRALFWNTSDGFYRALSETALMKLTVVAQGIQNKAAQNNTQPEQSEIDNVASLVNEALTYSDKAISIDPYNYYNHLSRARVLEVAASLNIPNSYENTKVSYGQAISLNPWNPGLYLSLARFEASRGKFTEAQESIGKALTLKSNYTEAIFFLSQVQVSAGRLKDAIISARVATEINPSEPLLFFQLGLLHYNDKNYSEAAAALEKAVNLNNQYANARYFLGLTYSRLGKNALAIEQFEELTKTNPDSQEVAFILSNLKSGKSPFADAQPPIDSVPEKRQNLPVDEKSSKKASN